MMSGLTAKQESFVRQYLTNGRDASAAYRSAYAAGKMSDATVAVEASRLLKHPKIAPRIESAVAKVEAETEITVERLLREYAKLGFSDIRKVAQWSNGIQKIDAGETLMSDVLLVPSAEIDDATAAAIAEVSHTAQGVKIKLHDKRAALDSIARILGAFKDKVELAGTVRFVIDGLEN